MLVCKDVVFLKYGKNTEIVIKVLLQLDLEGHSLWMNVFGNLIFKMTARYGNDSFSGCHDLISDIPWESWNHELECLLDRVFFFVNNKKHQSSTLLALYMWGKSTSALDSPTKGQYCAKCFHVMMSPRYGNACSAIPPGDLWIPLSRGQ